MRKYNRGSFRASEARPHTALLPPALAEGPLGRSPHGSQGFSRTDTSSLRTHQGLAGRCLGQLASKMHGLETPKKHRSELGARAFHGRVCMENPPKGITEPSEDGTGAGGGLGPQTPGPRAGGAPRPTAEPVQGWRVL